METTVSSADDISGQESPPNGLNGFVLGSYFYLFVSALINLQDSALTTGENTIRVTSTPDLVVLEVAMLGILVFGGGLLIGLYAGRWWAWLGSLVLFVGWAIFMAVIGKILMSGIAIVCGGYLLARAGYFIGGTL